LVLEVDVLEDGAGVEYDAYMDDEAVMAEEKNIPRRGRRKFERS
jgi:hypothetical protein